MPGRLPDSPAKVMRALLVAKGWAADPGPAAVWPAHYAGEPDAPDDVITVRDTAGRRHGRSMSGEQDLHHGFQIRVRSTTHDVGYDKANYLADSLDKNVSMYGVTLGAHTYCVHSVTRAGDVIALGKEMPAARRSLFTLNCLAVIRLL
jgi:hypothetical protein